MFLAIFKNNFNEFIFNVLSINENILFHIQFFKSINTSINIFSTKSSFNTSITNIISDHLGYLPNLLYPNSDDFPILYISSFIKNSLSRTRYTYLTDVCIKRPGALYSYVIIFVYFLQIQYFIIQIFVILSYFFFL